MAPSGWRAPVLDYEAGLPPPGTTDQIRFGDWEYLLDQFSPEEQKELRKIAELKIERGKRTEQEARAAARKPVRHSAWRDQIDN